MGRREWVAPIWTAFLLGCSAGGSSTTTPSSTTDTGSCPGVVSLTDPGELCLTEDGLAGELVAAGGCASILGGGCTAELDGDRIVVGGWAEVDPGCPATQGACVLNLTGLLADCDLPPLTNGTWTLVYGAQEVEVDWPLTGEVCVGEPPETYD